MGTALSKDRYCCPVRRHFLIGIIGQRAEPPPVEIADFILAWEPKIIVGIRYCPFCGVELQREDPRTVTNVSPATPTTPPDED